MSAEAAEGLECASTTTTSLERTKIAALQLMKACGREWAKKTPSVTFWISKSFESETGAAARAHAARCQPSSTNDAPASVLPMSMRRKSRREECEPESWRCVCELEWW